jgi:hypothetical protein
MAFQKWQSKPRRGQKKFTRAQLGRELHRSLDLLTALFGITPGETYQALREAQRHGVEARNHSTGNGRTRPAARSRSVDREYTAMRREGDTVADWGSDPEPELPMTMPAPEDSDRPRLITKDLVHRHGVDTAFDRVNCRRSR